ncbi:hypothetical protein [Pseudoflavonifractor sp. An85]|uniref:hypothetical protein n=1 Tax=Pseudoflavonifractor sp. An85 TaxID=1965661 RepID=UPI000B373C4D|nr:hypothetical protein [Pseudoflavonifractor sp. An85]OUN20833.1 hypothetical protein B5G37_11890 [Pseudoflavonifractor sp. An85]
MFRYKPSIPVPYKRQGYIYFRSLQYPNMSEKDRQRIRALCERSAGHLSKAMLEYVTTGNSVKAVCHRHFIASPTSIYRALKRYYELFPTDL